MRHRLIGSLLVCLFSASIFATKLSANAAGLRVTESATKFSLQKEKAVAKPRTLAHEKAGTSYWNLESNTPFYGWGLAGRIETAAVEAEIIVNGKHVSSVSTPPGGQLRNPLTIDLSSFLSRGNNRVEIRRSGNATRASAQVVGTHYEPWDQGAAERRENFGLRNSSALRLAVSYDKVEAKVGGYLRPRAGGVKFSFKFKSRYGFKARTAPSALYDYYNPEARVVIAPPRIVVR